MTYHRRLRLSIAAVAILAACFASAAALPDQATVARVVDGDTIVVAASGQEWKVRLIGVDTPEAYPSSKLDRDAQRSGRDKATIQALGKRASAFTGKLLPKGVTVRLEYDQANAATAHRGRYGRLLAYVSTAPGKGKPVLVNAEIIRQGYGNAMTRYPYRKDRQELFLKLQREAREAGRGLWGDAPEGKPKRPPTTAEQDDPTVYITRTGKKYHSAGCQYLRKSKIPVKLSDAKARGYGPCSKCGPPQ